MQVQVTDVARNVGDDRCNIPMLSSRASAPLSSRASARDLLSVAHGVPRVTHNRSLADARDDNRSAFLSGVLRVHLRSTLCFSRKFRRPFLLLVASHENRTLDPSLALGMTSRNDYKLFDM